MIGLARRKAGQRPPGRVRRPPRLRVRDRRSEAGARPEPARRALRRQGRSTWSTASRRRRAGQRREGLRDRARLDRARLGARAPPRAASGQPSGRPTVRQAAVPPSASPAAIAPVAASCSASCSAGRSRGRALRLAARHTAANADAVVVLAGGRGPRLGGAGPRPERRRAGARRLGRVVTDVAGGEPPLRGPHRAGAGRLLPPRPYAHARRGEAFARLAARRGWDR